MREQSIFIEALEKDTPAERAAFLDSACGGESDLRLRIERLLDRHHQADSFLESPPTALAGTPDGPSYEQVGRMIGPYKLLEKIGEGGFGIVYMAEQTEPLKRRVALKIIKPGMDTRQVIARFEAERQALAMMDHPNIARVFDAGAVGVHASAREGPGSDEDALKRELQLGRPYFVMELVHGVPITDYCDQCNLTTRERLELYLDVCQAVQHAHQKGVIHRDLKPSNVMIAMQDGRPAPKIIDFGVAKAIDQRLTEHTLITGFAQMIGTPLYMSPEQAEMSALQVDTRSDIYSLGVLLYELLTGTTPFEKDRLFEASYDEMRRIIREEEPLRPSGRLSTIDAVSLATVAERRRTEGRKLLQLVRGDLDWIVMKALDKDRNRRYATASDLARDIERFLYEEPVEARPPSTVYKFRKFMRRNKASVLAAVALMLTLMAGVVGTTLGLIRATAANSEAGREAARARRAEQLQRKRSLEAQAEAAKAMAVVELLREMLISPGVPGVRVRDYTVRALLDDFAARLDRQLLPQPELEAEVRTIVGNAYGALGMTSKAETQLNTALELRRGAFGSSHEKVFESLMTCAWNASARRRPAEAEALARNGLAIVRDLGDEKSIIATLAALQSFLNLQHKFVDADAIGREALSMIQRLDLDQHLFSSHVRAGLAGSRLGQGKTAEAEQLARQALEISVRLHGEDHPRTAPVRDCLVAVLNARHNYSEAEAHSRELLATHRKHFANAHPVTAGTLEGLGLILLAQKDYAGAEATFLEAQQMAEQLVDEEPAERGHQRRLNTVRFSLASLYAAQGLQERALAVWSDLIARTPENAAAWFWRGEMHRRHFHQWNEAIADYTQALQVDPAHSDARDKLAWILVTCPNHELRDPQRAIELAKEAVARAPDNGDYWNTLGVAYYRTGDWEAAKSALEKSLQYSGMRDFSFNSFFLAMVHWRLGHEDDARHWYARGVEWTEEHRPNDDRPRQFRAEADELMRESSSTKKRH